MKLKLDLELSGVNFGKAMPRLTPVEALVFFLAILPACFQVIATLKYGVNVPYWDQWDQVRLFQATSEGTLSFGDLMAQHNESRMFFPNLLTIALAFLTSWYVKLQMLVAFLLACLISFNVYRLGKLTIEGSRLKHLTIFLLSNVFIFAPIQFENWLWGIQYALYIPLVCITTSLLVVYSGLGWKAKLLICMVLATISTFSFANGILAWIVVFPVIASTRTWGYSVKKGWLLSAWTAGFALNAALYFYGYQRPPHHPTLFEGLFHPVQALQFFLSYVGNPYFRGLPDMVFGPGADLYVAQILGAVLLFLFASVAWICLVGPLRNSILLLHQATPWLLMGAYSIISGLLITAGRLGFGVEESFASKYSTFTLYLVVSLIHLIPIVFSNVRREEGAPSRSKLFAIAFGFSRRRLSTMAFGSSLIVIIVFWHLLASVHLAATDILNSLLNRESGKACLLLMNVVPDDKCLSENVYDKLDSLRQQATTANDLRLLTPSLVESDKLSDFARVSTESSGPDATGTTGLRTAEPGDYGYFDGLDKTDEDSYHAFGWAILRDEGRPADAVLLTYEDANGEPIVFAVADNMKERPDIPEATGRDAYLLSGWEESFSLSAVPAEGSTEIAVWAFDADAERAFKLNNTHELERPQPETYEQPPSSTAPIDSQAYDLPLEDGAPAIGQP
jgi:hypothetical protein